MPARILPHDIALDELWSELLYSEVRAASNAHAQDLAPHFAGLVKRTEETLLGQRKAWRAEIGAQAAVDAADDALDDNVGALASSLLRVAQEDRGSPRFVRYFPKAPSAVVRLGLESELDRVRGWPDSLKGEAEKELKALAKPFAQNVTDGETALRARDRAAGARADHRVREIVRLVDDANAVRQSICGELMQRAVEHRLPSDWAARFFRHGSRAPKAKGTPATVATPPAPAAPAA